MTMLPRGSFTPFVAAFALMLATAVTACDDVSSVFPVGFSGDCSTDRLDRMLAPIIMAGLSTLIQA